MPKPVNITELGSQPIGKLLAQYAVPAIVAMVASSLYNIVDSIFIGQGVSALAIAGVALTTPLMGLMAAFGAMVGVGAATLLSVKLGERDYESAQLILGNEVMLNVIMGLGLGLLSLIFLDPILYLFGASEATLPYARDFMQIILVGNVVTHLYLGLNAMLRSAGKPRKAMNATIMTVVVNVILAPLFIFVFHWGIRGAALATVLAQSSVLLWQFRLFSNKDEFLHLHRGTYRLRKRIVVGAISIGMSPFLINLCASLVALIINQSMVSFGGDMAVGAYGIVNRMAFLLVMIVIGLNQGMQPIAGYNYGARNYDRLIEVLRIACIVATIVMCIGFVAFESFPYQIARCFTTDHRLIELSAQGLRITMITLPLIGAQIVSTGFFQCIGQVSKSIFLSLSRQLLFLLPLVLTLPHLFGVDGVWYSMPISDAIASVVTVLLTMSQVKKLKRKHAEVQQERLEQNS